MPTTQPCLTEAGEGLLQHVLLTRVRNVMYASAMDMAERVCSEHGLGGGGRGCGSGCATEREGARGVGWGGGGEGAWGAAVWHCPIYGDIDQHYV